MASKNETDTHKRPVNLKVRDDVRVLIDRAAKAHGKTRSDFMIDAARRAAEDALLDQNIGAGRSGQPIDIISPFSTSRQAAKASNG